MYLPSPSGRGGRVKGQRVRAAELPQYKALLLKAGVIVDRDERKALIKRQVEAAALKAGAKALVDADLLSEVTFLVENPRVYVGKFRQEFINIPQEVLITSMQKNQKYFPLVDDRGKLLPKFAVVVLGGLFWNIALLHLLLSVGVNDLFAKLVATSIVLVWNFTLQKFWAFRT